MIPLSFKSAGVSDFLRAIHGPNTTFKCLEPLITLQDVVITISREDVAGRLKDDYRKSQTMQISRHFHIQTVRTCYFVG